MTPSTGEPPASTARTTTESGNTPPTLAACPSPDTVSSAADACATSTAAVALRLWNVAVTVPEPLATAVAVPPALTVNTVSSLLDHVTVPGNVPPR